jgi:DNA polymerase-1
MYILIDGNGILCRYIFAMKDELYDSDGILVSGVYGFCRMILKLLKEESKGVYIVFDQCKNNFRKLIDPEYKSNRPKQDKNIWFQVERTIEFCKLANIPFCSSDIYEGDDIISSIVVQHPEEKFRIIGVDKDFCQLVNERVEFFHPFKRQIICENTILEQYGVPPKKFDLFLTLCGDRSDNIKGIPGIGPKGAAKILSKINNIQELKDVLPQYAIQLDLMYSLVKLYEKVVIDPPLRENNVDKDEIRRFFHYMNFNSLTHLV